GVDAVWDWGGVVGADCGGGDVGDVGEAGLSLVLDWDEAVLNRCAGMIVECADSSGFGPPAELLSLAWPRESNQREGHPDIRPRLRRGSLLPVPLRGPSRRDVPVPSLLARRPASRPPAQHLHSAS